MDLRAFERPSLRTVVVSLVLAIAACGGPEGATPPGSDGIGSLSQAATAKVGAWNSCYIKSLNYVSPDDQWTNPSAGGPLCIEQWGSFPAACVPYNADATSDVLNGTTVTFAPGKRCGDVGYRRDYGSRWAGNGVGWVTGTYLTCAYGTFSQYNSFFSGFEAASAYNCVEQPPSAADVIVDYDPETGIARGQYAYSQPLDAPEGLSQYRWYSNTSPSDDGMTLVNQAQAFALDSSLYSGHYLKFCVFPALDVPESVDGYDGNVGGVVGWDFSQAPGPFCSDWQLVTSVPATMTPPPMDVGISFTDDVAQGNYVYTLNQPQTTPAATWTRSTYGSGAGTQVDGSKNHVLTREDNNQYLKVTLTEEGGGIAGPLGSSAWTPVHHLLELYSDDNLQGLNVNLPYEAKGKGYCFDNFKAIQFNDTLTSLVLHAPTNHKAYLTLYSDAGCTGASTTVTAPAASDYQYTLANQDLNDKVSSVRVVWNDIPTASDVSVNIWGDTVTGVYTFNDPGHLADTASTFVINRADDASGTNATVTTTSATRQVRAADEGNFLQFCVTPSNDYFTGQQVCSAWTPVGPLLELWADAYHGGKNIDYAYSHLASGDCFYDSGFNDLASSFTLRALPDAATTFVFYKDGVSCDTSGGTLQYTVPAGGTVSMDDLSTVPGWNDAITSMRVVWDDVPSASNVGITIRGDSATGSYTYADSDGIGEYASSYFIQRADDASGSNAINRTQSQSWLLAPSDGQKYLRFCVVPSDGIVNGASHCSAWTPVGHLLELYKDANYSGANINIAYEKSPGSTCFNLPDYGFNDVVSSSRFNAPSSGTLGQPLLNQYVDANCSGFEFSTAGYYGMTSVDNDYGSYNDEISSVSVNW